MRISSKYQRRPWTQRGLLSKRKVQMKLSICMMVKNEEKYLKECLESQQPLIDKLGAELIIVDTGSTDKTVEIARAYTKKLYFHEWQDDFSAMRNITIGYARGDWIMIIDGDEVIEDCRELIQFFKSDLVKKYNVVMVDVKNFVNLETGRHSMLASPRLFKRGNIRFEGAVHNQPIYKTPGVKLNNTVILHYGYIADDQELMERKFQRTSKILIRYQLSVSYMMHQDRSEALAEAEKAYDKIKNNPEEGKKYLYVYGHLAKLYGGLARYEELIPLVKEGLALEKDYIDLWFYLQHGYSATGKGEESIAAGQEYLRLRSIYQTLPISRESAIVMDNLEQEPAVYYSLAMNSLDLKQVEQAIEYFCKLEQGFALDERVHKKVIEACFESGQAYPFRQS